MATATLPLFFLGMLLIVLAVVCQLLEVQSSNRTISLEISDVPLHIGRRRQAQQEKYAPTSIKGGPVAYLWQSCGT